MNKITLAYFGTPDFSARILEKILHEAQDVIEVVCIVAQPDKPVGRDQILTASPAKVVGKKNGVPVYDSPDAMPAEILKKCDIALVFAYGKMIKEDLLRAPKHGFWNIHPSLLPRYRGASPVVYPIILGEDECGVTLIQMDEKMDNGPIISQEKTALSPEILHDDLLNTLADMSYYMLIEAVQEINTDSLEFTAQADKNATYTKILTRQDGYIPYGTLKKLIDNEILTPEEFPAIITDYLIKNPEEKIAPQAGKNLLWNLYRGLHPWPGIWTEVVIAGKKKRLKITEMSYNEGEPLISRVQLEGKNSVPLAQFVEVYPLMLRKN